MFRPSIFNDNFTDSLFDEFFNDSFWPTNRMARPASRSMNTDIKETENNYQIEMELPGFTKEDVKADLKDGYLTIQASHDESKDSKDENGKYLRKERYFGRSRSAGLFRHSFSDLIFYVYNIIKPRGFQPVCFWRGRRDSSPAGEPFRGSLGESGGSVRT